ncbi:MAG: cation-transporting P-type ATPase [Chloroflexota bacterium]
MKEPWSLPKEEVLTQAGSVASAGLSAEEAQKRLRQFGFNRLTQERTVAFWRIFRHEVTEPMIRLLFVVGIFYAVWGELRDALTILAVITALVFTEVFTDYRAGRAIAALRKLSPSTTPVIRGGSYLEIPAFEVVPGDIVPMEPGVKVPADARVIESFGLQLDESALTGESVPVEKEDKLLPGPMPLPERSNMVFAGTTVTSGRGRCVVTATGMATELGKITGLVLEAREPRTPLQQAMRELAGLLVWVAVFFSAVIPIIGIIQRKPYQEMILTGLSLAFATIPEELPIIITMVLGLGAFALSKKNVLIRRLRAAETLGEVTVIAADKTGTITQNKMTVVRLATPERTSNLTGNLSPTEISLLRTGALTSHLKKSPEGRYIGDPMEVALLEAARANGNIPEELPAQYRLLQEFSFDNKRKMMSTVYEQNGGSYVYAKGAPEVILAKSSQMADGRPKTAEDEKAILSKAEEMAGEAMRVIALAYRKLDASGDVTQSDAEKDLTFLGLVGLADPPRPGVSEAIRATEEAGIRTIIVSGDHALTVARIAEEVGIKTLGKPVTGIELAQMSESKLKEKLKISPLFARITPQQKLQIVQALQGLGEVVAVTGDGINDAPALKSADIGIAMGETGTESAREAAGMVLTDDSFTSIVDGVREGRKIYDNLKKGVMYYLSVKVALVLSFLVPLTLGLPLPFAPIQIVLLELFMDLAASATFVAEPMEPDSMKRPPRSRKEKFIDARTLVNISLASLSLALAVVFNYLIATYAGRDVTQARSIAFGTWLIGHIFLAFTMRSMRKPLWRIGLFSNKIMPLWALAAILFFVFITSVPFAQAVMKVTVLSRNDWLYIVAVPFISIFWLEIKKLLVRG